MEIIVKVNKLNDIFLLDNADAYLLSNKHFSYRYDESFCINKIRKVKSFCKQNNKKVYVLINKIFKDEQLEELRLFLEKLKKVDVDGIYFADFAMFMLAKELGIQNKCVFYHETFLRNSYDILTYQSFGINKIVCSKDMHIDDINNLPLDKKDSYGIICFGYIPLYQSERKIISNYVSLNGLKKATIASKELSLKENTRDELYKVIEQNGISSIFASDVLCYLPYIDELEKHINSFIIDSLFFDVNYIKEVISLFKNKESMDKLVKLDESISFSSMFLKERVGLV